MRFDDSLSKSPKKYIWGVGDYFNETSDIIDEIISDYGLCDSDKNKVGNSYTKKKITCISPQMLYDMKDVFVIICTRSVRIEKEIQEQLKRRDIKYCHINEIIKSYIINKEKNDIALYDSLMREVEEPGDIRKIKKYITISLPVEVCNLRCNYCYISQISGFDKKNSICHSAGFIRRALSRKRLGGTALINFCGAGETLLQKDFNDIVYELLEEGHCISIVTNALLKDHIRALLNKCESKASNIFFKCSFHYEQLVKNGLLQVFVESINMIKESNASYTVELVADDSLIPFIDDIKEFSIKNFGALPHIAMARDDGKDGHPIITTLSDEDYYNIWSSFKSKLFNVKYNFFYKKHICDFCSAGINTVLFSLESGKLSACPFTADHLSENLYDNIYKELELVPVGDKCTAPWCVNSHVYASLGIIPNINVGNYFEMRDRVMENGEHWIKRSMAEIMIQRVCDNM